jgi:hypothetical protein
MMRRLLVSVGFAAAAWASAAAGFEQMSLSCLYSGKLYSDGALICVQKALMLNCSSDGMHAAWKPVIDQGMQSRCLGPATSAYAPAAPRHRHGVYAAQYRVNATIGNSAKCFDFAGKRYCE